MSEVGSLEKDCKWVIGVNASTPRTQVVNLLSARCTAEVLTLQCESGGNTLNSFSTSAALVGVLLTSATTSAIAAHDTALAKAAADLGYAYSYLGPEDAAALTRPGVTIVIRPGEALFDVNDRTEAMSGPVPRFAQNDIYISDALLARLRQLAARYPAIPSAQRANVATHSTHSTLARVAAAQSVTGAITNLKIASVPGDQRISVDGKAPANLPIILTLIGTFSTELPDVVLSRHEVIADTNGSFQSDISIAAGYYRGGILTLVASSVPGITSAKAQFSAKAPNATVSIPADQVPRAIR